MNSVIKQLDNNSPLARKAHPGDKLISINENPIVDVLDYKYYSYDMRLVVELESPDGRRRKVKVKKHEGGDLGLEFETYLMDKPRHCRNKCLFCFIDQLPDGMRKTLYFKDDDARLSFLTGNYITLTNLSQRELERIIALHISPINISVHATEPDLRARLLGNPNGARGYELMRTLSEGGITMNCQIVCCPGINDGAALERTMEDLESLYPHVNTVSVVPVGLTRYRQGLAQLRPFDRYSARETITQVEEFSKKCFETHGSRIFFLSDEFFIKAELPIPEDEYYEDYTQYENGVGIIRLMITEFLSAFKNGPDTCPDGDFSLVCGVSASPYLQNLLMTATEKYGNISVRVYPIVNDFFGHTIDVTGLVTGGDLISQLKGRPLGENLLIPSVMLRDGDGVFLDDVTLEQVEKELSVHVTVVDPGGDNLFDVITGETPVK